MSRLHDYTDKPAYLHCEPKKNTPKCYLIYSLQNLVKLSSRVLQVNSS